MEKFTDTVGAKRKGVSVICPTCGAEFFSRADQVRKYCSLPCSRKGGRTRITVLCGNCGKHFQRVPSKIALSKSGYHFCGRGCKDKAQKLGGIPEIMPPHFGTAETRYRDLFELDQLVCVRCGYKEFDCGVDIHHIDADRTNNCRDNLVPLCKCCHTGLHNKRWSLEEIQGPRV